MSELFPFELKTPEDIIRGIEQKILTRPQIIKAIEHYGNIRAREAREDFMKQIGFPLKQEIVESISRMNKMIDELFEKTILAVNELKKGESKK
jgi:hypothetical protein